jgi:hypothetical protein
MLLPTPILLFLILISAPSSIAAGRTQNDHVPPNCVILPRTDECDPQHCAASGALCVPNPQPIRFDCIQKLQNSSVVPRHWTSSSYTRKACWGCYCGTPQSFEVAQRKKAAAEQRKVAAAQTAAQKLSLKRKVQELEMNDGNCIMTSQTSNNLCHATQCHQDGIRCLPDSRNRLCYFYSTEETKKIRKSDILFPATCIPCTCKIKVPDWWELIEDPSVLEPSVLDSGPARLFGNDLAEASRPAAKKALRN